MIMDNVKYFTTVDLPILINIRGKNKAATLDNIENARKQIKLNRYKKLPKENTSFIWDLLSSYYPFDIEEINDYLDFINYKNFIKNPYLKYMNIPKFVMTDMNLLAMLSN